MRHYFGLTLALAVTTLALLAPAAHAQGADLQGTRWTDPSGTYLVTVGEGVPINPPAGGGGGAWVQYTAIVTYRDGSALMTTDDQGNPLPIDYTLTVQLHGNGNGFNPFQVEFTYVISAGGLEDTGVGHLALSGDQNTLDGNWKDNLDGSTGHLTLVRLAGQ
jgi:hypothetical protein